ncbi:caspase, EACC1-associated type [Actinomadura roseirufa]|uniref:caspase, EACC1-associated type n=1 Tax=Actinomadura roseirufa TaxID=2094049 RepID=UPI0010414477|nr:YDG/SRA domain-containing protein [Actinomadura roseirufa]
MTQQTPLPDPLRSRAVLIGTSKYTHLPQLPAVGKNLEEFTRLLTSPRLCGLPPEHCAVISNPESPAEMIDPIAQAAEEATDVLLVYFAGHGLVHSAGSDLYLTLAGSHSKRMYTSVAYDHIRNELRESRARRTLVILDCCYSGRAVGLMADDDPTARVANSAALSGVYVMASTAGNRTSKTGDRYTAFSGALFDLVNSGIPECEDYLSVDDLFLGVREVLKDGHLPAPQRREVDYGASLKLFRNRAKELPKQGNGKNLYGEVPGVEPGTPFESRMDLHRAGIHRPLQAGICGTAQKGGAESIVVSGGYKDDKDYGDTIIYTGHGGRDRETGEQVKDQSPEDTGNAALIKSMTTGNPVRVIRGSGGNSDFSPEVGYSYDGLFRVTDYWIQPSVDGPSVLLYRLERVGMPSSGASKQVLSRPLSPGRFERLAPGVYALPAHADEVKARYEFGCQICDEVLRAPGGQPFASAVYIRGLEAPHRGPDALENMLCLCSNHRDLFKFGSITIEDDFRVIDETDGEEMGSLTVRHEISLEHIRYHREHHRLKSEQALF